MGITPTGTIPTATRDVCRILLIRPGALCKRGPLCYLSPARIPIPFHICASRAEVFP